MKWLSILALAVLTAGAQETVRVFRSASFEFEGKVVSGAPYSAQAVTETTQVLADGTRITNKLSAMVARDSQGRTRREQNLGAVGPWATAGGKESQLILINDPVAGARYQLEPGSHSAVRVVTPQAEQVARQDLENQLRQTRLKKEAEARAKSGGEPRPAVKKESLGTQVIEGVQAEGWRITETIPAGRIGNDRPIDVVNETWTSPELQTVVMSKHSDPRVGDVTYTLTNISRAEPDPALFTVPSDYTVRDDPGPEMKRIQERRP